MSQKPSIQEVLEKYEGEALVVRDRIRTCERELETLHAKLQEIRVVMEALMAASQGTNVVTSEVETRAGRIASPPSEPAPPAAAEAPTRSATPAPEPSAPAAEPPKPSGSSASERAARRTTGARTRTTSSGRKGRRKAVASETNDINDLSIVEAAIELARRKNVSEADAGVIHRWFTEENYLGRSGEPPNRNSIFVSLNREYNDAMKRGEKQLRVERPQRGLFRFNFDA
jgi:hypothetical protein